MNRKRKQQFRAGKEVKRRARRDLGSPPPTRRHDSRKHKPPRHKQKEMQEESG
jgi:hypothetical protein